MCDKTENPVFLSYFQPEKMVIDEPEHLVKKNLTFSKILPEFEYWTREGKISKIIIHKPDNPEHFGDLHRWMAFIAYDGFHDNWKMCDVVSLLDDDVRKSPR